MTRVRVLAALAVFALLGLAVGGGASARPQVNFDVAVTVSVSGGQANSSLRTAAEAVRTELRGSGVTVTAVCPGPVRTEFMATAEIPGVEDRTPGAVWMSAEEIARQAVEGAARDKRVVVPGVLNRAGALAGQHSPRAVALPLIGRIWRNL